MHSKPKNFLEDQNQSSALLPSIFIYDYANFKPSSMMMIIIIYYYCFNDLNGLSSMAVRMTSLIIIVQFPRCLHPVQELEGMQEETEVEPAAFQAYWPSKTLGCILWGTRV